jgi:hypothetical protein
MDRTAAFLILGVTAMACGTGEVSPSTNVEEEDLLRHGHHDASAQDAGVGLDASLFDSADVSASADVGSVRDVSQDVAPADTGSGTDGGSTARLLFMSDFGGTVALGTPYTYVYNSGRWPIQGGDDGFNWPILVNGGETLGLQPIGSNTIVYNPTTGNIDSPSLGSPLFAAQIVTGTRHDGTTGGMLHQAEYQNYACCQQMPYVVGPGSDVVDLYIKTYMKLPADFVSQLGGSGGWSTFAEWKDSGYNGSNPMPGYRIAIYILGDGTWDMHGDNSPPGPWFWDQTNNTVPIPPGQWFMFEWAWHRTHDSSSYTWVKINGTKIMQQNGGGTQPGFYGTSTYPIDRIFISQLYGTHTATVSHPFEQWTDHVEVWSSAP